MESLIEKWEKMKEESDKTENAMNKEVERLRTIISEKIAENKDLKAYESHNKELY